MSLSKPWILPDGSTTLDRPKDGHILHVQGKDSSCMSWQWDDFLERWHNISTGNWTDNTATFCSVGNEEKAYSCECGAKHTQSPGMHLSFCPLYMK